MKLWGREEVVVGVFGTGSLERINEGIDEWRARSTCVAGKYNAGRDFGLYFQVDLQLVVLLNKGLVGGGVCQGCCMSFPRCLTHCQRDPTVVICIQIKIYTSSISP